MRFLSLYFTIGNSHSLARDTKGGFFMASEENAMITLVQGHWAIGGVERVEVILANEFVQLGHRVNLVSFQYDRRDLLALLDGRVNVVELRFPVLTRQNFKSLRALFLTSKVNYVVNNWALPVPVTFLLKASLHGCGASVLAAMQHNLPNSNKRIGDAHGKLRRWLWKTASALSLRAVYALSDAHIVTSKSFIPIFGKFIGVANPKKSHAIRYPLTLMAAPNKPKENAFVYVGRLEQTQKRVDRIIAAWREVCAALPDWRLDIVGDGPDRQTLEEQSKDLPRIKFHGFQNPKSYYETSKVILLTSDFEGFGLVLVEAMTAGCVPIILGSYPAAYEIADGSNGVVLPTPFDLAAYSKEMMRLAKSPELLNEMSKKAVNKASEYSPADVAKEYIALFERLMHKGCK